MNQYHQDRNAQLSFQQLYKRVKPIINDIKKTFNLSEKIIGQEQDISIKSKKIIGQEQDISIKSKKTIGQDICNYGKYYKTQKLIGQGVSSKVYQVKTKQEFQKNVDGSYVIKEFKLPIKKWMEMEKKASEFKIAPHTELLICEKTGKIYLIQERVDGTLNQLIKNHPQILKDDKIKKQLQKLLSSPIKELQIYHNDIHGDNILYKQKKDGTFQFYLVDFENFIPITKFNTLSIKQRQNIQNSNLKIINKKTGQIYFNFDQSE
jgi:serine/threonine protein kinase